MRSAQRVLVCTASLLLVVSTAAGQDFSAELRRGRRLLEELDRKPVKPHQIFAEAVVGDQVVGYASVRLDVGDKDPIRFTYDMVVQTPGARISGHVKADTNLTLQPKHIEIDRAVRPSDGKTTTERRALDAVDGKLRITLGEGTGLRSQTKSLPAEPFFFSADLLASRSDIGRVREPFAIHELDPDTGQLRLLVFRPLTDDDGTQVIKVLVGGRKPEAVYHYAKDGKLLSWSEAGAPVLMKIVDEERGAALIKQFGQPQTRPATTQATEKG